MKKITTIIVMLILFFWQCKQISISYANEHEVNDGEDTSISNAIMPFSKPEFYTIPNDTGITIASYLWDGGHVDIPAIINGQPVTIIGESSFFNKNVTSVTIPDSVTKIGDRAFLMNQLTAVTIPNSVTHIGNLAFFDNQLTTVAIPDSVKIIGAESFSNNQLTSVTIPDGITRIENGVFTRNKLESVTIPSSVTSIGNYAFYQNLLTTIILPDGLTNIGDFAFYENHLVNVDIPDGVTYIGVQSFYMNKLTELTIPNGVTNIAARAFQNNRLTNLHIPNTVTHIGDWTFANNQLQWVRFQSPLVLQPNTFVDQGNTFDGWYKDLAWATPWDGNITQPTSIYAKGNALTYTVTFNTNNGTAIDEQKILAGEKALAPADPTKIGSLFMGWYKDEELTVPWNFATDVVTEDLTLYGKWMKKPHTVAFHNDTDITTVEVLDGVLLTKPLDPTKTGYTFLGWYKDEELTLLWNFDMDKVTEDMTLYGEWIADEYSITFYTDGGTAISPVTAMYNKLIDEPPFPIKADYRFLGWYKDEELTKPWSFDTDKVTENTTLHAKWEKEAAHYYTLDFVSNGGSTIAPQMLTASTTATQPANPIREGYTFAGWYKDAQFTIPWNFKTDVITANLTLYAKWLANASTGGGESSNQSPTPIPAESVPMPKELVPVPEQLEPLPMEPTELQPTQPELTFLDISQQHWGWQMIQEMAKQGIIIGYPDGTFQPNVPIQRQHVALMLTRALELEPKKEALAFNDIPESHMYFEVINQVQQAGLFDGIDGNFQPNANMTRAQMAKVLVVAFNLTATEQETFKDVPSTHWAYAYIANLAANGIAIGDQDKFRPNDAVTRAEFTTFLYRALLQ